MGRGSRGKTLDGAEGNVALLRRSPASSRGLSRRERIAAMREGILAAIRPLPTWTHGRDARPLPDLPDAVKARIEQALAEGREPDDSLLFARSLVDGIGRGLDPESVLSVAALHFLGVETTASCNGHEDRGYAFPWIDFTRPRENGQFLLEALPGWTIVQRGQGESRSYRLNPRQIEKIDDQRSNDLPFDFWEPAREELDRFARAVLRSAREV